MELILSSALSTRDGMSTGTFAPTTTCGALRAGEILQRLYPAGCPLRSSARPGSLPGRPPGCECPWPQRRRRSRALSSASGPNTSASPNRPASPISRERARIGAGGHCVGNHFGRAHQRDFRARETEAMHHFNRVDHDLLLLFEIWRDDQAAVGNADDPAGSRQRVFIEQDVAQQPPGAQPGILVKHGMQQFIAAQMSLEEHVHGALAGHARRHGCGRCASGRFRAISVAGSNPAPTVSPGSPQHRRSGPEAPGPVRQRRPPPAARCRRRPSPRRRASGRS